MASSRLIHGELFEDDFVGSLSFFERLLWVGLFGAVADDQGRFLENFALIRVKVYLYDANVTDDMVEKALVKLATAGKIVRYSASGKRLCQIVNWWKYQKPSWASESKYPAPEGWHDRVKMHVQGGGVVSRGWDEQGGYLPSGIPSGIPSGQGRRIGRRIKEVKGEVNGEGDGEGESEANPAAAAAAVYEREIGPLTPIIRDAILDAARLYPLEWLAAAMQEAARANARNWRYCEAILKRWAAEGFQSRKSKSGGNGAKPNADATKAVIEQVAAQMQAQMQKGRK